MAHRAGKELSIAMRSGMEQDSRAMVMWYVGLKGRSLIGGVFAREKDEFGGM